MDEVEDIGGDVVDDPVGGGGVGTDDIFEFRIEVHLYSRITI